MRELLMHGTVTFSWDTVYPFAPKPQRWTHRWGKQLRSVRVIWLWFAIAWYRMDDRELVAERHEWSGT
jgi:hypothetical protein